MARILIFSDTHFTNKPDDEYRQDLWKQGAELIKELKPKYLLLAGDLTEAKDQHNSKLVNRIVDGIIEWARLMGLHDGDLWILRGNHDGYAVDWPFFRFLGNYPNIKYFAQPTSNFVDGSELLFLPHSRDPVADWASIDMTDKIVFAHVTVNNAIAESMQKLTSSVESDLFTKARIAFSGDVHKPQEVGPLIYIGSPYNVRFSDNFDGNAIVFETKNCEWHRIPLEFPRRYTLDITSIDDLERLFKTKIVPNKGHQVKIRLTISPKHDNTKTWRQIKDYSKTYVLENGCVYMGCTLKKDFDTRITSAPREDRKYTNFESYCSIRNIPEKLKTLGAKILETAKTTR